MKKWIIPGIFTLLVTGMIFMSGCTGPVSTNTTAVTPSAIQIVNYTVPVTPNPVPTTPVPTTAKPTPLPTTQNPTSANATPVPTNQSLTSANTTLIPPTAVPAVTDNGYNISKDIYDAPPSALPVEGVTGTLIIYVGGGSADAGRGSSPGARPVCTNEPAGVLARHLRGQSSAGSSALL